MKGEMEEGGVCRATFSSLILSKALKGPGAKNAPFAKNVPFVTILHCKVRNKEDNEVHNILKSQKLPFLYKILHQIMRKKTEGY
jgi:hypothetical protein